VEAGYVRVVTTDLTKTEIAKKHAGNDFEVIGDLTKRRVRDLVSDTFGVKLPAMSPAELHRTLLTKYQAAVEEMFRSMRAETLSIDSVKPSVVFDAYARKTGLFGDDAKKDQFPDAFIFEVLKAVATERVPLTIVSDDKDFAAAIKDATHITRLRSIADLFSELGLAIEGVPGVEQFVEQNLDTIINIADNELNQFGLHVNDVEDADIIDSTVEGVTLLNLRAFRAVGKTKDILVVGSIEMVVHVSYQHPDWDTASYDSEDGVLIPHDTVEGEKNVDVEADFNMTLKVNQQNKPVSIADFSFDDGKFISVSIRPNDLDYK
jgi:PIN domain